MEPRHYVSLASWAKERREEAQRLQEALVPFAPKTDHDAMVARPQILQPEMGPDQVIEAA